MKRCTFDASALSMKLTAYSDEDVRDEADEDDDDDVMLLAEALTLVLKQ